MSPDDCVELVSVHRDGTVNRWTGENLSPHTGPGGKIVVAETTKIGCRPVDPTTTRPLRKVTTVRARHCRNGYEVDALWNGDRIAIECDSKILPEEALGDVDCVDGPLCDFRVEVEAVRVEEEGR